MSFTILLKIQEKSGIFCLIFCPYRKGVTSFLYIVKGNCVADLDADILRGTSLHPLAH